MLQSTYYFGQIFQHFVANIKSKFNQQPYYYHKQEQDNRYASSTFSSDYSSDDSDYEAEDDAGLTAFQKTYVSFPEFTTSDSATLITTAATTTAIAKKEMFTLPEVITTTAVPSFYNKPHFKPIWIR